MPICTRETGNTLTSRLGVNRMSMKRTMNHEKRFHTQETMASTRYQDAIALLLKGVAVKSVPPSSSASSLLSPSEFDLDLLTVATECDMAENRLAVEAHRYAEQLEFFALQVSKGPPTPPVPVKHESLEGLRATLHARSEELFRLARITGGKDRAQKLRSALEPEDLPSTAQVPSRCVVLEPEDLPSDRVGGPL